MSKLKFRSRNGEPVRVILTSGQCAIVGNEWCEIPETLHLEAYSLGCVSDNMEVTQEVQKAEDAGVLDKLQEDAKLKAQVRSAIEKAVSDNNLRAFTNSGNPVAKYITDSVGHTVDKHIRDAVWNEMLEEGTQPPQPETLNNDIT